MYIVTIAKFNGNPESQYVRWFSSESLPIAVDPIEEVDNTTISYHEGIKRTYRYTPGGTSLKFILDTNSKKSDLNEFADSICDLVIKDISDALSVDESYIKDRLELMARYKREFMA